MRSLVLAALAASAVSADYIMNHMSFGQKNHITENGRTLSGFEVTGEGHTPEILSDRVILTPPYPGNRRGALWAKDPLPYDQWSAELEFRVAGQERGSGNMQVWYTKDGHEHVEMSSIYTVGQFDGLALVIDQYGGGGGSIRGFLNDGTKSFKDHHHVDSLAFGSCGFSYRNLGRFVKLNMRHTSDALEVEIDGHACFKTHKVPFTSNER